ncbi:hypothetical protein SVAN01_09409 [Stagonosporopsis vannaccii]|nr:hypothetical protein SVAN01_09409 [Stagonosporopsis vannaccii]
MEATKSPRRVLLRFHVKYERSEAAIIQRYLASINSGAAMTYIVHSIPPTYSSKVHTVLDLHHLNTPFTDVEQIPYKVFLVEEQDNLSVTSPLPRSRLMVY